MLTAPPLGTALAFPGNRRRGRRLEQSNGIFFLSMESQVLTVQVLGFVSCRDLSTIYVTFNIGLQSRVTGLHRGLK